MSKRKQVNFEIENKQKTVIPEESVRVQRAEWVHEQVKLQRKLEDEAWEKMMEEQRLITERNRSIDEDMARNRELQRFHEGMMEDMTNQVYALHGISEDKLEGMREYKNARFQGNALMVIFVTIAIAAISAYLWGPTSDKCFLALFCVGAEAAMLSQLGKKPSLYSNVLKFFFYIPMLLLAGLFSCQYGFKQYYDLVIVISEATLLGLIVFATVPGLLHNPYRVEKRRIKMAASDLKQIEKVAKKNVKRNQSRRSREEARAKRKELRSLIKQRFIRWMKKISKKVKRLVGKIIPDKKRLRVEETGVEIPKKVQETINSNSANSNEEQIIPIQQERKAE